MIYPDWLGISSSSVIPNPLGKGVIEIEKGWQILAVPIKFGYYDKVLHKLIHETDIKANIQNYILDQIEDKYKIKSSDCIAIANTYTGDNQFFFNYIPGVTNPLSSNNFNFIYTDGINEEYIGFWIKSVSDTPFKIIWGE